MDDLSQLAVSMTDYTIRIKIVEHWLSHTQNTTGLDYSLIPRLNGPGMRLWPGPDMLECSPTLSFQLPLPQHPLYGSIHALSN